MRSRETCTCFNWSCKINCKVIFYFIYFYSILIYFITHLQSCPKESNWQRNENDKWTDPNNSTLWLSSANLTKMLDKSCRCPRNSAEVRDKAGTSPRHCHALLNLLPLIVSPSLEPSESQFLTCSYSNSNNNTEGFVPARRHRVAK